MTWIKRKADAPKPHECKTPWRALRPPRAMSQKTRVLQDEAFAKAKSNGTGAGIPEGDHGDIWACDVCGQVWTMIEPYIRPGNGYVAGGGRKWIRAGWWMQRKYAPRYACGCRIDKPQASWCKNQPHPGQRMVTVHGAPLPKVSRRTVEEIESTPPDD